MLYKILLEIIKVAKLIKYWGGSKIFIKQTQYLKKMWWTFIKRRNNRFLLLFETFLLQLRYCFQNKFGKPKTDWSINKMASFYSKNSILFRLISSTGVLSNVQVMPVNNHLPCRYCWNLKTFSINLSLFTRNFKFSGNFPVIISKLLLLPN